MFENWKDNLGKVDVMIFKDDDNYASLTVNTRHYFYKDWKPLF